MNTAKPAEPESPPPQIEGLEYKELRPGIMQFFCRRYSCKLSSASRCSRGRPVL